MQISLVGQSGGAFVPRNPARNRGSKGGDKTYGQRWGKSAQEHKIFCRREIFLSFVIYTDMARHNC